MWGQQSYRSTTLKQLLDNDEIFWDRGKTICLCQNGSRHKNMLMHTDSKLCVKGQLREKKIMYMMCIRCKYIRNS